MYVTHEELIQTVQSILIMRKSVPWYQFIKRYQLLVMSETLIGVGEWMEARAQRDAQRNCGCADHTNPHTN